MTSQDFWAESKSNCLSIIYHSRFFVQVGHETTYAAIGNCHFFTIPCPNVSTTPITAMVCRQCLPLSVVQLKGKHCRKRLPC